MRTIAWTTSHWDNEAQSRRPEITDELFGLEAWHKRVTCLFKPIHSFIACGTWSDPAFSPLDSSVAIVNAGIKVGIPYDYKRYQYWMAAFTSASAYVLNLRNDWDLLLFLDTDSLVGAVDFKSLLSDFMERDELIISNSWSDTPSGPFFALKMDGVARFLHCRLKGNCVLDDQSQDLMLGEYEIGEIYKGLWWNPWPEITNVRQDYSVNPNDPNPMAFMHCPFIRQPHPAVIEGYQSTQWSRVVPLD